MRYNVTDEAHRLPKHKDYILVDDSEWCGEEEPGDGDVEDRDGANERVRADETHLGLGVAVMCELFRLRCLRSLCLWSLDFWDPDCLIGDCVCCD
jgi:hypothetical protein